VTPRSLSHTLKEAIKIPKNTRPDVERPAMPLSRLTALTTAREQGSDIIDLQDFAGHADPRTTLTYIRNRDRLSKSPAYVLRY
jgi:integrase